jgi:hypothetical protein
MKILCGKLTYANVMVTILAFAVLGGGTAWAATHLGKNSVGARQLKKGSVTSVKLSKGAKEALIGAPGAQGARGAEGARGPVGLTEPLGTSVPLAINASAPESPLSTTSSPMSLNGRTSWTAPDEPAGLLVAQLKAKLATNGGESEICQVAVQVFDNGELATTLVLGVGFYTVENTTLTDYRTTSTPVGIGLVDRSATHTITAKYLGNGAANCVAGSKFEGLRVIVQPLG